MGGGLQRPRHAGGCQSTAAAARDGRRGRFARVAGPFLNLLDLLDRRRRRRINRFRRRARARKPSETAASDARSASAMMSVDRHTPKKLAFFASRRHRRRAPEPNGRARSRTPATASPRARAPTRGTTSRYQPRQRDKRETFGIDIRFRLARRSLETAIAALRSTRRARADAERVRQSSLALL